MDRAYEDDEIRALAIKQGLLPVVPPKKNRKMPWEYDAPSATNVAMKLSAFAKFLLVTTSSMLSIFLS